MTAKEDLVTLRPGRERARFEQLVEKSLWKMDSISKKWFNLSVFKVCDTLPADSRE